MSFTYAQLKTAIQDYTENTKQFLEYKDTNFVQTINPNSTTEGTPRYYALFDVDNFILAPTPDSNFTTELHYFYRPASLTAGADSGTTWLSTEATNCLLYGCLIEAYIFMKGEQDLLAMYDKRFAEALVGLKQFGEAKETTDQYRTGMVIRPKR